jgi:hypothetical protein
MAVKPEYRELWDLQYDVDVLSFAYRVQYKMRTAPDSGDLRAALAELSNNFVLAQRFEHLADLSDMEKTYESYECRQARLNERMRDHTEALARLWAGAMALFLVAFGGAAFIEVKRGLSVDSDLCTDVDADIVGDGVRAGAWAQSGILILVVVYGRFSFHETAAKEIGAGLLITHMSLVIALLVPLVRQELSPVDGILGAIILDVQNVSLSVQLMVKDALAARWQVYMVIFGQAAGLATIAALVSSFTADHLAADGCRCFSAFWWAWFGNCADVLPNEARPFWIYYFVRCVGFAHSSYRSVERTSSYHHAELRRDESDKSKLSEGNGLVNDYRYDELPATASFHYAEYSILALLSIIATEITMSRYSIHQSALIYSVGQIIPVVIAGETILRAFWVTLYRVYKHYCEPGGLRQTLYRRMCN